jgi:putative DNA primase/helicase
MAERANVSVIGVRHLNKSVGLKAIQRGGCNMGVIGVARAGAFFAEHPDGEKRRVMAPHKSNLAEKPPSLSYRIVTSTVHNTARVEWMGATDHDANSLAAGNLNPHEKTELEAAKEFLREELKDGRMWAKRVYSDARDAGISERTVRRAKDALRVKSEKIGTEGWAWSLPSEDDQGGHVGHVQNTRTENPFYLSEGGQDVQASHVDAEGGHLPDRGGAA